ncbi:isomerase [Rubrivivax gelatinosus]|uniref:nuclear transport factor 2 family protein n=1 Tax=Rubrivivax gelatinosus TaxID=28068 RepID=UPI00190754C0|nr:nuclear transport factor 2 family protein [Rubrivivax gelatinosus]MBK1612842.1 isomerase [Rubrivivax gelatinosus]
MSAARHADPRVQRLVDAFEQLSPAALARLDEIYTPDAAFKDPFNEVRGVAAIRAIFEHMFRTLDAPRFVVHEAVVQGEQCFLTWDMHYRMKRFVRGEQLIRGATHVRFAADGRVALHRDYWDAAEELYEKLPALGAAMRWLRRRAAS